MFSKKESAYFDQSMVRVDVGQTGNQLHARLKKRRVKTNQFQLSAKFSGVQEGKQKSRNGMEMLAFMELMLDVSHYIKNFRYTLLIHWSVSQLKLSEG